MMRWNDAQRRAFEVEGDACVAAAAGSGKTAVLVERVLHLVVERGFDLGHIVAITFTEAAAAEMKERLRRELRAREAAGDPDTVERWRALGRRLETARISTIHSFCASLLRENAVRADLDPEFGVMTDADGVLMADEAARATVVGRLQSGDESALLAASILGTGPLMDLLRTLLQNADPDLPVMPSGDAAALQQRWSAAVQDARTAEAEALVRDPEALRLIRELEALLPRATDPTDARVRTVEALVEAWRTLAGAPAAEALTCLCDVACGINLQRGSKTAWEGDGKEAAGEALKAARDYLKAYALAPCPEEDEVESASLTLALCALLHEARAELQRAKRAAGLVDFNDLVWQARDLLREHADVRARVVRGVRALLIDEFQDTDPVQYEIASLLKEADPRLELFLVGDPKQSIYGFRGADVALFAEAREGRDTVTLDRNYRTTAPVIAFINDFFSDSGLLAAVEPVYRQMVADRECGSGGAAVEFLLADPADSNAEQTRREEARLVASRLQALCDGPEGPGYGGAALLFRAAGNMHYYERELRERGIPYQVVAGKGYYERQEVRDAVNLLHVVANPWDEMAVVAFLRGPVAGLPDDVLAAMAMDQGVLSAFHDADYDGPGATALGAARTLVEGLRAAADRPLQEFVRHVFDTTQLEGIALAQFLGAQRASNVRKLVDLAGDYARSRSPRLDAFIRYLEEQAAREIREGEAPLQVEGAEAVTLMTIHKSKGLEFPVVVLPDLGRREQGGRHDSSGFAVATPYGPLACADSEAKPQLWQLHGRACKRAEADEAARLLYVAMTRARDRLLLAGPTNPESNTVMQRLQSEFFESKAREAGETEKAEDAEIVSRPGWEARVWRTAEPGGETPHSEDAGCVELSPPLLARLEPASPGPARSARYAASTLSHVMAGEGSGHDASGANDSESSGARSALAAQRGTLVHELLEHWTPGTDLDALVGALVRESGLSLAERAEAAQALRALAPRLAKAPLVRRLLDEPSALREAPFSLQLDDALVVGTVDAVLENGEIVDWKTGGRRAESHAAYEWQVRLYALAMRQLQGREAPGGWLYYVDRDEAVAVDVSAPRLEEARQRAVAAIRASAAAHEAAAEAAAGEGEADSRPGLTQVAETDPVA